MKTQTPPRQGEPAHISSPDFLALMKRLDELQQLRYADPRHALALLADEQPGWPVPAHDGERGLLQARHAMQVGSAHLVLGEHALAFSEFERMVRLLDEPALRAAEEPLRRMVQRCAAAGANARAVLAHAMGDMAGALRAYLQALDLARALADRRYEAHVLVNLANTYEETGLAAEALEHLQQALVLAVPETMDELVGDIHHNMGNALAAIGDLEAGLLSNRQALQCYGALPLPQKQRYAWVAIAERLLELGRADEAQEALSERARLPQDYTNQQYEAYAAYLSGRIAARQGRPAQARRALAQAQLISSGTLADPVGQARAQLALAGLDLDDQAWDAAAAQAEQALELLAPTAATRDQMQAHEMAYRVARLRGDLGAALAQHERFHEAYTRCINAESVAKARLLAVRHEVSLVRAEARSARLENARLSEALAEISARLAGARSGSAAHQAAAEPAGFQALGLTPREAEVLYWVAQGKTNEDVADILGASQSTVKKHLLRVFDKLGVQNRTAAANMARRQRVPGPLNGDSNTA
jgi:DNA-binding CsgD family transcriptional regulator